MEFHKNRFKGFQHSEKISGRMQRKENEQRAPVTPESCQERSISGATAGKHSSALSQEVCQATERSPLVWAAVLPGKMTSVVSPA